MRYSNNLKIKSRATGKVSLIESLENVGKITALASIAVLAISVAYDFGFLRALGLWFSSVPTTVADHARTAIIWVPGAAILALCVLVIGLVTDEASKLSARRRIQVPRGAKNQNASSLEDNPGLNLLDLVVVGIVALDVFLGSWKLIFVLATYAWFRVSFLVVIQDSIPGFTKSINAALRLFIGTVFTAAFFGYSQAEFMINLEKTGSKIVLKGEGPQIEMPIKGVRRFSSVTIVIKEDNTVMVVPNERVTQSTNKALAQPGKAA